MYAKVFRQMYDGTLATNGPWEALVTFQQLLVLANDNGEVDMTAAAISRQTTIPLNIIERGLGALSAPDPESRTPDEEGRRIVLLASNRTWGWRIVNFLKYRAIQREQDRREYHRAYYHAKRKPSAQTQQQLQQSQQASTDSTDSTDTDTEAEAEATREEPTVLVPGTAYRAPPAPNAEIVELYRKHLPELPGVEVLNNSRKRAIAARWREVCVDGKLDKAGGLDWFAWYFGHVAKSEFLMGRTRCRPGERAWHADFDFLMTPTKFAKVVEGSYHKAAA